MKENKKSVSTKRASHCKASKEKQEDFIMLPVDLYLKLTQF